MRRWDQRRWEKIRAGGKNRFVVREVAICSMIPIVATLAVYGLKMGSSGRFDFDSVPYGQTAFSVVLFALWGYFRAGDSWMLLEEKRRAEAGATPNSDRADG